MSQWLSNLKDEGGWQKGYPMPPSTLGVTHTSPCILLLGSAALGSTARLTARLRGQN